MSTHDFCLRCKKVPLVPDNQTESGISFFACPECGRHYARRPGRGLTFQWLHPISLALYGVIYDAFPCRRVGDLVRQFVRDRPPEHLRLTVQEIRLELEEPTQRVRDILNCRASEQELREFLRLFADGVEAFVQQR